MARGKRRLLFDVLGSVQAPSSSPRDRGRRESPPRPAARPNELVLSRSFAGALGLVAFVFLGLAYWFGLVHGQSGGRAEEPGALMKNRDLSRTTAAGRDELGTHYAVKAAMKDYAPETYQDRVAEFRSYVRLLKDKGYDLVDVYRQVLDKPAGCGTLSLWVGRASNRGALEALARELQPLTLRGEHPFEYAFPALFTGPGDR